MPLQTSGHVSPDSCRLLPQGHRGTSDRTCIVNEGLILPNDLPLFLNGNLFATLASTTGLDTVSSEGCEVVRSSQTLGMQPRCTSQQIAGVIARLTRS